LLKIIEVVIRAASHPRDEKIFVNYQLYVEMFIAVFQL